MPLQTVLFVFTILMRITSPSHNHLCGRCSLNEFRTPCCSFQCLNKKKNHTQLSDVIRKIRRNYFIVIKHPKTFVYIYYIYIYLSSFLPSSKKETVLLSTQQWSWVNQGQTYEVVLSSNLVLYTSSKIFSLYLFTLWTLITVFEECYTHWWTGFFAILMV